MTPHMVERASSSRVMRCRGDEFLSHDATMGVEAVQVCQWSEDKAAPILLKSGRKGDSGWRVPMSLGDKTQEPHTRRREGHYPLL